MTDFVQGNEKIYEIEVEGKEAASRIVKDMYPDSRVQLTENGIALPLKKEKVPEVIKRLVNQDIQIYGVKEVAKTLEDRFLD